MGLGGAVGASLGLTPALGWAQSLTASPMRVVAMHNLHTDEKLEAVYWEDGDYIPDVLDAVNHHLRDYRTGDIHPIDPRVLDLLTAVTERTGSNAPFQVISGYRSPQTNAMLHERSAEVAKKSLHIQGMAIDVRLSDVALDQLHAAAMSLYVGGVGLYPDSNFVHLDVGPVRSWYGS